MPSKAPVCKYYLKNNCRKGSECKLSHSRMLLKKSKPAAGEGVCSFYRAGNCAFGGKCKKSHGDASAKSKSASSSSSGSERSAHARKADADDNNGDGDEQAEVGWGQEDQADDSPTSGDVDEENAPPAKSPCVFFDLGLCGKGDECPFAHSTPGVSNGGLRNNGGNTAGRVNANPPKQKGADLENCRRCRLEDVCRCKDIPSVTPMQMKAPARKAMNHTVAAPECSDSSSDPSAQPPPWDRTTDMTVPDGPDADEEHITSLSEGDGAAGVNMHPEGRNDNPDDEGYDLYASDHQAPEDNVDRQDDEYPPSNNSDTNQHGDTTIQTVEQNQHPISSNGNTSSDNGPTIRRSWYGDGWDETKPPSTRTPSPAPVQTEWKSHEQRVPQPKPSPQTIQVPQFMPQPMPQPPPMSANPYVGGIQPHWSQYADPLANSQIPFCKLHAQSRCAGGAACRFRHALTPAEYTLLFQDQQPNLWTLEPTPSMAFQPQPVVTPYFPAVNNFQVESPIGTLAVGGPTVSAEPHPSSVFAQECKFYPLGSCRNGPLCPFLHTQHPEPPKPMQTSDDSDRGPSAYAQRPPRDQFDRPCRYFMDYGTCKRKSDCKYRHDNPSGANKQSADTWGPAEPQEAADNGWGTSWDAQPTAAAGETDSWTKSEWGSAQPDASAWGVTPSSSSGWGARKQTCRQFSREGKCDRGDNCRFEHDAESRQTVAAGQSNSGGDDLPVADADEWPPTDNSSQSAPWVVASVPCRFYAKGDCRRGTDCPDLHDGEAGETSKIERSRSASRERERRVESEAPPEMQPKDSDDDNSWPASASASWPAEDDNPPADEVPSNEVCKMFLAYGYCTNIEDCAFKHLNDANGPVGQVEGTSPKHITAPDDETSENDDANPYDAELSPALGTGSSQQEDSEPEEDPIVFDHREINQYLMQSEVVFGKDMTPEKVTTPSDSNKLILSNLPLDVSPDDIVTLTKPYGRPLNIISLEETVHSATIQVEFEDPVTACQAFKRLHSQEFRSMEISAKITSRVTPIIRSVGQKLYVKVSWPRPARSAWSHYDTISKAKQQVVELNNVILRGRSIKVSFVPPKKNQKTFFAVHLENLDPDTSKAEIDEICKDNSLITLDPPLYDKDATDNIKFAFAEFGEVEQFDPIPAKTSATSTAFVTFQTEAMAAAAVGTLKSQPLPYLAKRTLLLQGVHYTRYCISRHLFESIQGDLDNLQERCESSNNCCIQYNDHPSGRSIWIRIFAPFDNITHFANVNRDVGRLLQGITLASEGKPIWDDYFETSSGAKVLEQIQKQTDTLINCDHRAKRILVFGSKAGQAQAQTSISKLLTKVHAQRHEIILARPKLNPLINGGFKTLQDTIGANKVSLDIINSTLVVRGTAEDVQKAEITISALNVGTEQPPSRRGVCQICHHEADNPILLSCRHAYCTSCLQYMLRQKGSAPFRCISQHTSSDGQIIHCSAHVPFVIIEDNLPAETKKLLRATLLSYIRSRPDEFFFCPSLDCDAVHRVREEGINIKCTACAAEVCTYCRSLAHIGRSCNDSV